jgi:hypothetical protein
MPNNPATKKSSTNRRETVAKNRVRGHAIFLAIFDNLCNYFNRKQ